MIVYHLLSPKTENTYDAVRLSVGKIANQAVFESEMAYVEYKKRKGQEERPIYESIFSHAYNTEMKEKINMLICWLENN